MEDVGDGELNSCCMNVGLTLTRRHVYGYRERTVVTEPFRCPALNHFLNCSSLTLGSSFLHCSHRCSNASEGGFVDSR